MNAASLSGRAPGEHFGSALAVLTMAVQLAFQLGLHRDPDRSPVRYNPLEGELTEPLYSCFASRKVLNSTWHSAEDRRRIYWLLVTFELLARTAVGRTRSVFNFDLVDTRLPLDVDDEMLTETGVYSAEQSATTEPKETVMTSLLIKMKIAQLAKKIVGVFRFSNTPQDRSLKIRYHIARMTRLSGSPKFRTA